MEAERDALGQGDRGDGRPGHFGGVEHDEVAGVTSFVVDSREQPTFVFAGVVRRRHEHAFAGVFAGTEYVRLGGAGLEVVLQQLPELDPVVVATHVRGVSVLVVTTVAERLREVRSKIDTASDAVRADQSASPVLTAVVSEFAKKAEKAVEAEDERGAVIELEQAGDSAKAAAEADTGVSDATRNAVLEAHLAICIVKSKL